MTDIREGHVVPIPCRPCGRELVPTKLAVGKRQIRCPRCGDVTLVAVTREAGELRVRTELPSRAKSARVRRTC